MVGENGLPSASGNGNGNGNRPYLTGKQRAFLDAWFENGFNGLEAARSAGYAGSDNTLKSIAAENLTKPNLKEEISRRWAAHGMDAEEVTGRLVEQARGSVEDFVDVIEPGRLAILNLAKAQERGKLHLIKRLYWTQHGPRLELHDSQKALELIARTLGMFKETTEHTGTIDVIIDI